MKQQLNNNNNAISDEFLDQITSMLEINPSDRCDFTYEKIKK